jgi:hypothetical protein
MKPIGLTISNNEAFLNNHSLYDLKNNELASVYCKIITLCDKYLITDNSIYKIEIKEN